jgi:hypothetical protein
MMSSIPIFRGVESYRALLKNSKTGKFVEEIIEGLSEEKIVQFFPRTLSQFHISDIIITTER